MIIAVMAGDTRETLLARLMASHLSESVLLLDACHAIDRAHERLTQEFKLSVLSDMIKPIDFLPSENKNHEPFYMGLKKYQRNNNQRNNLTSRR